MTVYPALVRTEMFTPEVLARMPERVNRTFIEPAQLTAALLRGLERGALRGDGAALRGHRVRHAAAVPRLLPPHDRRSPAARSAGPA